MTDITKLDLLIITKRLEPKIREWRAIYSDEVIKSVFSEIDRRKDEVTIDAFIQEIENALKGKVKVSGEH